MRAAAAVLALCIVARTAAAQDPLAGTWQGYWSRAGDSMAVTLRVQRDPATGRYAATFDAERLRVSGIPFNDVQLQGCCAVTLTLRGDRTTMLFTGAARTRRPRSRSGRSPSRTGR